MADPVASAGDIARLLEQAKPIPLRDQVRVDKVELESLIDALGVQSSEASLRAITTEIESVLENARPVPLTDQVRIQKGTAASLAARLRAVTGSRR